MRFLELDRARMCSVVFADKILRLRTDRAETKLMFQSNAHSLSWMSFRCYARLPIIRIHHTDWKIEFSHCPLRGILASNFTSQYCYQALCAR